MITSWQTDGCNIPASARPGDLVYSTFGDRGYVFAVYPRHVTVQMCYYSSIPSDDPKGEPLWYLSSLGRK